MERNRHETRKTDMTLVWNPGEWRGQNLFQGGRRKVKAVPDWKSTGRQEWNKGNGNLPQNKQERIVIITCSDPGIEAARRMELPVIAVRNGDYERQQGAQSLFGAPVLLEDPRDLENDLLEKVWKRYYGLPLMIGETRRFVIREVCEEDIPGLYEKTGGMIHAGTKDPVVLEQSEYEEFWKAYIRKQYGFYEYGLWLIEKKEQEEAGNFVGLAGFTGAGELSYWIFPEFRRRGYAKEVCSYLLETGAAEWGWEKISLFIRENNTASCNLARTLGCHLWKETETEGEKTQEWVYVNRCIFLINSL